jgi:hypothetical protein
MEVKTERIVAYGLAIILFVVGIVCYAAFPVETPEKPIRIIFKSTAGNVLFDHNMHTSKSGYGIGCADCHHTLEDEGEKPTACGDCHEIDSEDPVKRSDAFHTQCKGCHEDGGAGPVDCSACHVR